MERCQQHSRALVRHVGWLLQLSEGLEHRGAAARAFAGRALQPQRKKQEGSRRTPAINEDEQLLDETMAVAGAEVEAQPTQMRDQSPSDEDNCFAMNAFPEPFLGRARSVCSKQPLMAARC